jgi:hypothetical protein
VLGAQCRAQALHYALHQLKAAGVAGFVGRSGPLWVPFVLLPGDIPRPEERCLEVATLL